MKRSVIYLLTFILLILPACSSGEAGWKTYNGSKEVPINLEYPSSMQKVGSGTPESPLELSDNAMFLAVTIAEYQGIAPPASQYVEELVKFYEESAGEIGAADYKKLSYEDLLYNEKFKSGILTSSYRNVQTDEEIVSTQYMVPYGPRMYGITINIPKESYESRKADIDRIIKSVKITK